MNRDKLQPLLALGDDIWKVEENGRVVVRRRCDCHRWGGAGGTPPRGRGGATYPERTEEREGKNDNIVGEERRRRQCPFSTMTATMESPSGVRVDLSRSAGAVRNTRLRHLGGAIAGRRLPRLLRQLDGKDHDRDPRSGVHPAEQEVRHSCGSSTWRRCR